MLKDYASTLFWILLILPGFLSAQSTVVILTYENYAQTLNTFVDDMGMVNYKGLKKEPSTLNHFIKTLAETTQADYDQWTEPDKIAFWINTYNGLTLKAIIDHYPIESSWLRSRLYPKNSIRQISGVWDTITFNVVGRTMTLEHIEHKILRAQFKEPRIHVALVCAAMGCPPLRNEPYTGEKLNDQLNHQMKLFLCHRAKFKMNREKGTVYLSPIFQWFAKDFVNNDTPSKPIGQFNEQESAVIQAIAPHLEDPFKGFLLSGKYKVKYLEYDWSLNEQH